VPMDPHYPAQRQQQILEDAETAMVIRAPGEELLGEVDGQSGEPLKVEMDSRPAAYVIYTSGSTGRPKGGGIEHGNASRMVEWGVGTSSRASVEGMLASTSVCFDLSVYEMFVPLSAGGSVVVVENGLEIGEMGRWVKTINTVPTVMEELARRGEVPEGVRAINVAGEALSQELGERLIGLGVAEGVNNL